MKKNYFCFLLFFILPFTVHAQKYNELVNPELIPVEYRTQGFDRARQAVVRFNDECTGTFISNHGHLLTALHCLNPRVSKNLKALDTKLEMGVDHNRRFYMVGQTEVFSVYKFAGAGNDLVSMGNNLTGKILVTGKGYYLQIDHFKAARKNPKLYQDLMDHDIGPPEDFAIVKLDLEKTPCVPIAKKNLELNDFVWTLAYPAYMGPFFGADVRPAWDGSGPGAFSKGKITDGFSDNEALQEILNRPENINDEKTMALVKSALHRPHGYFSNLDILSGSSGGPLFNKSGELAGVTTYTEEFERVLEMAYVSGVSGGPRIEKIILRARFQLDAKAFAQTFSCKDAP